MKDTPPSEPETRNPKPETFFGEFISHSPQETFELAKRIGEQLKGGKIFLLKGDLGAGKTIFAKGLAAGLGVDPSDVTSPSFTLINVHEGRLRFYHVDLYRLEVGAHQELGLQEMFEEENAVTLIEWAERLSLSPGPAIEVAMSFVSNTERRIRIVQL